MTARIEILSAGGPVCEEGTARVRALAGAACCRNTGPTEEELVKAGGGQPAR